MSRLVSVDPGRPPFEEVHFLELRTDAADAANPAHPTAPPASAPSRLRALWVRLTRHRSPRLDRGHVATWITAWFDDRVITAHATAPLHGLDAAAVLVHPGLGAALRPDGAGATWRGEAPGSAVQRVGTASGPAPATGAALPPPPARGGPVAFALEVEDGLARDGLDHALVPDAIAALGVGRTYAPALADARVRGTLTVDGAAIEVRGRGVLGHLHGASNRLHGWAWAHGAGFAGAEDVVVELLSARLGLPGGLTAPPLLTAAIHADGARHELRALGSAMAATSRWDATRWRFATASGDVAFEGTIQLDAGLPVVLARYQDPQGRVAWCRNSATARLEGVLTVAGRSRPLRGPVSAEVGSRHRPSGRCTLPPWPAP